ncbi:MAG: DUF3800 domain-containing protein [Coriobacteriia bacterium]
MKAIHLPGCEYFIYCDESRHTSDPSDRYMVIGALSCPASRKRDLVRRIHNLRAVHATQGEFGWKRLSPNKRAFYRDLMDLFLQEEDLQFRCIVVNRATFVAEDMELGFYKLYYQMLVHWLSPECSYRLYLDFQQNREQGRFRTLRDILRRKLSGRAQIRSLEPVDSSELPLMQLADLLIGAVGYAANGRTTSDTKRAFCDDLAHALGRSELDAASPLSESKFNVFRFNGGASRMSHQ